MENRNNISEKFIHRDLSWLSFNERVLAEAADPSTPLAERLRFLAIFSNNMDEFFMVRVAGLKRLVDSGYNQKDNFGYFPTDILLEIKGIIQILDKKLYSLYKDKIAKDLEKNKIFIKKYDDLSVEQKKFTRAYFETTLFPIITPMAVDQGRPFPILPSKTIAFAVALSRYSNAHLAIMPVPKSTPRILRLPSNEDELDFILIDEIIRQNIDSFFKGYKVTGNSLFRVIRDSELSVDEEYSPNLLKAIESEVKKRPQAKIVCAQVEKSCPAEILESLFTSIDFPKEDITGIDGELGLNYLFELAAQINKPQLFYKSFVPQKIEYDNIFEKIKEGDLLIHLPYQSFQPTIDLVSSAAKDDNVLAIKMTLYRTNEESAIIKALKEAAKNKKQVTILVEIKARFDEERNIDWAKDLEASGCHVMYGIAGMKIHSKITLVVRKEEGRIRRYVHVSTGNYNERTAVAYTDTGYFTANDDFAKDISEVFNAITGYSVPGRWNRIVSSPYDLRQYFMEMIDKEIEYQKKYKNGFIFAKMNSLEDPQMAEKLYEASCAGVKIKLIVRGICVIIPGVKNLSENIEIKSIVGRFLEHSRIYMFNNNANPRIFMASSDWMTRNFDRRIELLFEIYKDELKEHLRFILDISWRDNTKTWVLSTDKKYIKPETSGDKINAQDFFIKHYA